jgi:alkylation response protein AidB-like acyl-CoA dehydrogenase
LDFSFSPEALSFGQQVRDWLSQELDPGWSQKYEPSTKEWVAFQAEWDRKLYRAGWGAIFWPEEYGGLDAGPQERVIFAKVMAEAGAPNGLAKLGKRLLAPALINHGSAEQKARFLPPILRGETFWAQGFSEPSSGSDLASLRTRGTVDGDELVINGQKIWTSHAWYSDAIFALIRTSTEAIRQRGISFVLVPTDTPGLSIRKIHQINRKADFSECFFEDARVPLANVVGPLGEGWTIAKSLLQYERGAEQAFGRAAEIRDAISSLLAQLTAAVRDGDPGVRQTLGQLQGEYLGGELNALRLLGGQVAGHEPGNLSAVVKLQLSEGWRRGTMEHLKLLGPAAFGTGWEHFGRYLDARSATIASGSSEVQRDIIARRVLGLPG